MTSPQHAVYGLVPPGLTDIATDAVQCSPRVPGARVLTDFEPQSLANIVLHAPPNTVERRAVLALGLRALVPGGSLTVLAANTKGGTRLRGELEGFGCTLEASHKRKYQIVSTVPGTGLKGLDEAIADGAPRILGGLGLWSQPGLFNWDRIDPGSQLLLDHLPPLEGRGADLGCGIGVLARAVRAHAVCPDVILIDIDARALAVAQRNVPGDGVTTLWADVRSARTLPTGLDFVVMNPPFHDDGEDDVPLGLTFIQKAAAMLKPGGVLWLTANRHLPYEATLKPLFHTADLVVQAHGFKVYAARKAAAAAPAPARKARRNP
jgi:16S rRNA (guanine1207-N2)-methyltransferase